MLSNIIGYSMLSIIIGVVVNTNVVMGVVKEHGSISEDDYFKSVGLSIVFGAIVVGVILLLTLFLK